MAWALPARVPRRLLALALGGLACSALAFLPGEAGPLAARAGLATAAVAALAVAARGSPGAARAATLQVTARAALGRSSCVALIEVDGRRFLVGAGDRGLELLAELDPAAEVTP